MTSVHRSLAEVTAVKDQALREATDACAALADASRQGLELCSALSEKEATLQEASLQAQTLQTSS